MLKGIFYSRLERPLLGAKIILEVRIQTATVLSMPSYQPAISEMRPTLEMRFWKAKLHAIATWGLMLAAFSANAADSAISRLPASWQADWAQPPVSCRPLQIVHGIPPQRATVEGVAYYKDRGLGGIVCNVAFDQYMISEEHWKTLISGVEACQANGLRVWIYDEHGYPSGAAGGLVLKNNPSYEAMELAFDPSQTDPFLVRPAYEFSHASANYHAARRYVNLMDDRAIRCFIETTHQAYANRLGTHFGRTIEAVFTDEPSLIAVNIGDLPAEVRKKVRVIDPLNPKATMLRRVPWAYDLAAQYQKRYGEDLMPKRRSLFAGDTSEDRKVRCQYWDLVAGLVADRYFGQIQQWCSPHRLLSSGHNLWEEAVLHHVPLYGNGLKALSKMDIPGLDMLSSDPEAAIHEGWLTAALPFSAGVLNGHRRLMTEISDFSEKMGGRGPASLDFMKAAAAWQAAWGVTEFTLYYSPDDRSQEAYRSYGDYVGRLNAVLREAKPVPQVLLYYPIYDLWSEYKPVAEPLQLESQTPRAQKIVSSFKRLGQALQRSQVPFLLADHELLAKAKVEENGDLAIRDMKIKAVVFPEAIELPSQVRAIVDQAKQAGGKMLSDQGDVSKMVSFIKRDSRPVVRLEPSSIRIAAGHFTRDGHCLMLLANLSKDPYQGIVDPGLDTSWLALDPASSAVRPVEKEGERLLKLSLAPYQAVILVEEKE